MGQGTRTPAGRGETGGSQRRQGTQQHWLPRHAAPQGEDAQGAERKPRRNEDRKAGGSNSLKLLRVVRCKVFPEIGRRNLLNCEVHVIFYGNMSMDNVLK